MPLVTYIDTGIPTDVTETKGLPVEIVGTSGGVDTELPASAALADDTANPTVAAVGAFGQVWNSADINWDRQRGGTGSAAGLAGVALVTSGTLADAHTATPGSIMDTAGSGRQLAVAVSMFNGTNYDRLRGSATDGLTVNLGTNNDVTVTSGTVDLGATDNAVLDAIEADTTTLAGAVAGTEMQVDVVAALPAGTNAIGKLAANSGVDIGDVDVTSIASGTNSIGNVGIIPRTTGGMTIFRSLDIDESEEDVKTNAGQVFSISAFNTTAAPLYLKFYNLTAANTTVGTSTPVLTFVVPGNADSDGAGFIWNNPIGFAFATAICVACTTGVADADTGAPGANACVIDIGYA